MPRKANYLEFEDSPELEFEFFLCIKVGAGSVARMRSIMPQKEFMQWYMYYQRDAQRKELASMKGS